MNNLLILGAGQYGMVAREIAESMGLFSRIAFLDDNSPIAIGKINEYELYRSEYSCAVVAIGNSELRLDMIEKLSECGYEVPVLIHEKAYVSPSAVIEKGSFIEPMVVVHTGVTVGVGCIISAAAILNHNCTVEAGSHINCGSVISARSVIEFGTKTNYGEIFYKTKVCEVK